MIHLDTILNFLVSIGIKCQAASLSGATTFLSGIKIENGTLLYDVEILKHEGDLLHEAGHIALEPPASRYQLNGNVEEGKAPGESLEIGVILWCRRLQRGR
jgi:hypothetical protein